MTDAPPDPARLFLVTPRLREGDDIAPALAAALEAGDVACVLVRHAGRDERGAKALLRGLVPLVQDRGAAFLVEDDVRLAGHLKADGVHMAAPGEALEDALGRLKPDGIVGCGGLALRDDAMAVGELDVDYLLFGEQRSDGSWPEPDWTRERVGWWAEIFNVPCIGFAQALGEVVPLVRAGAEFVALGEVVFGDPRGAGAAVRDAMAAIEKAAAEGIGR
jgi:thiamine-phosphate pyrophosphorylase